MNPYALFALDPRIQRKERTAMKCANCEQDVTFADADHALYPDGKVQWCYRIGCVLVAGAEHQEDLPKVDGIIAGRPRREGAAHLAESHWQMDRLARVEDLVWMLRTRIDEHVLPGPDPATVVLAAQVEAVRRDRDGLALENEARQAELDQLQRALQDLEAWVVERREAKGTTTLTMVQARIRAILEGKEVSHE